MPRAMVAGTPVRKVIIDTDPGVDDAMAISLALRSPELQVLALTTVHGNVGLAQTTANARRLLGMFAGGQPVAIGRGAGRPLRQEPFEVPSVHGADGLGEVKEGGVAPVGAVEDDGVKLILNLVRRFPKEVTVVAIGPLTNIAHAIQRDPDGMRDVGEIVVMGGAVMVAGNIPPGAAEFNVYVDPDAAEIVFTSGLPVTLVPLDVTHQVKLSRELARQRLERSAEADARFLWAAAQRYMDFYRDDQGHDGCYLHDPLAVGIAIDRGVVRTSRMPVYVETEGRVTRGMTLPFRHPTRNPVARQRPEISVCTEVDAERFLQVFLDRVGGQGRVSGGA
jgi:purine nucleosidase